MTAEGPVPLLDAEDLRRIGSAHPGQPCPRCLALVSPGWEALPATFDAGALERLGTLRAPGVDDPTLEEFHPGPTRGWSPDAPIAPGWFPYNRCDVWACAGCARPFLRYTEYGGYYVEERVRQLDAALVVNAPQRT